MKDIRQVKVSLILRLDDVVSGRALSPEEAEITADHGFSRPLYKREGYFVFTGNRPEIIYIAAENYEPAVLSPEPETGPGPAAVLRIALVPVAARQTSGYELRLPPGTAAHIGFAGSRAGYVPAGDIAAGAEEITLQKNDLRDITSLWHLLLQRQETGKEAEAVTEPKQPEQVFLAKNLGYGKYRLLAPTRKAHAARQCRLLPLYRLIGPPSGVLHLPLPPGATALYVLEANGRKSKKIVLTTD